MASPITTDAHLTRTAEDWLRYDGPSHIVELIHGDLVVTPPPAISHQRAAKRIFRILARRVEDPALGEVFFAPTGLYVSENCILEPDVMVALASSEAQAEENWLRGPVDLVVEILSPGSMRRDTVTKRALYEQLGVAEYWLVDPARHTIERLRRVDGSFVSGGLLTGDEAVTHHAIPGLSFAAREAFGQDSGA